MSVRLSFRDVASLGVQWGHWRPQVQDVDKIVPQTRQNPCDISVPVLLEQVAHLLNSGFIGQIRRKVEEA